MPLTEFVLMRLLLYFEKFFNHLYACRKESEGEKIYV